MGQQGTGTQTMAMAPHTWQPPTPMGLPTAAWTPEEIAEAEMQLANPKAAHLPGNLINALNLDGL